MEPEHALSHARPVLWANRVDESMQVRRAFRRVVSLALTRFAPQYMVLDKKRRAIVDRRSRYTEDSKQADDDPYLGINVEGAFLVCPFVDNKRSVNPCLLSNRNLGNAGPT